jgi:hypothetical protein
MESNIYKSIASAWLSVQDISKKTSISTREVVKVINALTEQNKIRTRVQNGRIQHTVAEKKYGTLDEFMLKEIGSVPRDKSYSSEELANVLLELYPESPWGSLDISKNIAKFVRIGSLGTVSGMNGSNSEHHYAVL